MRNLAESHGGTVTASSEGEGKGSELCVRLPLARPARPSAPRPVASRAQSASLIPDTRRALLVDYNEDAAALLAESLQRRGYTVRVAHDGPTALTLAADFQPQIALLDIGLPVMDGNELAARLRALQDGTQLRLIALTGYGQESNRLKSRQAGFDLHLVKPASGEALAEAMRSL